MSRFHHSRAVAASLLSPRAPAVSGAFSGGLVPEQGTTIPCAWACCNSRAKALDRVRPGYCPVILEEEVAGGVP